jgi:hypothetical protein
MHVSLVTKCVTGDFLQLTFNDVGRGELGTMMSGGREGGEGGVKKCFLGLRQTALLSAEGKKVTLRAKLSTLPSLSPYSDTREST